MIPWQRVSEIKSVKESICMSNDPDCILSNIALTWFYKLEKKEGQQIKKMLRGLCVH